MPDSESECKKLSLILTATVRPSHQKNLMVIDPVVREQEYIVSLKNWIHCSRIDRIYFCDNSGWDLSAIKESVNCCERVKFISVPSQDREIEKGKGYCEVGLIEAAIKEIENSNPASRIVKSTGRNWVSNSDKVLSDFPANCHILTSDLSRNLRYSDSRFFVAPLSFYRDYVVREKHFLNDDAGFAFENMLARWTLSWISDGKDWYMPHCYPRIIGVSGSRGTKYSFSVARWLAFGIRKRIFGR